MIYFSNKKLNRIQMKNICDSEIETIQLSKMCKIRNIFMTKFIVMALFVKEEAWRMTL